MSILILIFVLLLVIGLPIAFVLGGTSLFYFFFLSKVPMEMIGQKLYAGIDNFVLLAIPFFILAGELMNRSKITDALIEFSRILVGKIPGALAQVNIVASVFFAGITGAGVADTAALGSILIPAMTKEGYTPEYSAAVTCTSSVIGPIIPPSIVMIIYATCTGESVGALFAAGFIPGLMIALALMIMCFYYAIKQHHPRRTEKLTAKFVVTTLRKSIVALLCPIILIVGIFSGYFTPTEAAAVACLYAIIAGMFILKTLTLKDIWESLKISVVAGSVILLLISMAALFAQVLSIERVPAAIATGILAFTQNKYVFLLIMNGVLLIAGMLLDAGVNVMLIAPILLPVAIRLGITPLHFALVLLVNLNIGLVTPPMGVCLFAAAPIARVSFERVAKASLPFIAAEFVALLIMTYVPELILFVPRLLGYL
ncbi:TRAP transporter large permease [Treponema sp. Marseille-Q4132]|jgi:tripartite ATP-independent transporter DctM subunit|uniref:TRAP transporter large permease n=1 Tax=Treponema sp. Marseille-Q4132 TaxID=2766701 RepID=UPI000353BE7F|nr:TRAP transporter large permease [Treponema sp. Marseille-Q4132]EPF25799.1 TRAP transporter, DctM subunit [Treponema socranskii subsp. paredis ATCC 35535]QNL96102.1 TRAP transporter large permease [Treponema sp. Marseille-Q4132]